MSASVDDPTIAALSARAASTADPTIDALTSRAAGAETTPAGTGSWLDKWPLYGEIKGASGAVIGAAKGVARFMTNPDVPGSINEMLSNTYHKITDFGSALGKAYAVGEGLDQPDPNAAILDYARGAKETITDPEKRGALGANVGIGLLTGRFLGPEAATAEKATEVPKIAGTALKSGDVPIPKLSVAPVERAPPSTVGETETKPPFVESAVQFKPEAEAAPIGSELPASEQARRRRVLAEVGINQETPFRNSALTGDPLAAGTDAQIAKLDTPAGHFVKGLLNNERDAVTNYAQDTVRQTGGHVGEISGDTQTDNTIRGRAIVGPSGALDALDAHLEGLNKSLYKASDAVSKGRPLPSMPELSETLGNTADFQNFSGGDRLLSGVKSKMQKLGMMDEDGNVLPSTVRQSEALRQFINEGDEAYTLRARLRDAIDKDVFSQSGEDIYGPARALYKLRKDTLENPNGINRLMSAEGPEGINRKTPYDKVMTTMETMDPVQLDHVMKVLRSMSGDLADKGSAAISNIQAHFASRFQQVLNSQAEQLNARGAHNFLAANSERLNTVFSDKPEVLHRMYAAAEAAKILRYNASYPGAQAQAVNLAKAGVLPNLVHKGAMLGGEALGSVMGFPGVGTVLGESAGAKVSGSVAERAALARAKGRAALPPPE